jgi:hypothetical protein
VATRAGVSEHIFSKTFAALEECYRAAYDEGLARLSRCVAEATRREDPWLERVRAGLVALLGFFDDEPSWARLLMVEAPLSGALTFECRQRLHGLLAGLLEPRPDMSESCSAGRVGGSPTLLATLTGDLVIGGVFSVMRANMLGDGGGKLVELAPQLMAFIVAPHLGRAAAQAELRGRPSSASDPLARERASQSEHGATRARAISRAAELPIRVTHRTTQVWGAIARSPYSNNREVAQAAGLTDEGQASKLLARLERRGVIENVGVGAARGEPNAWLLTPSGRRALDLIGGRFASGAPRPRASRAEV